jgi:glycosyltransferase involved in cell wall biosynthesis
MPSSSMTVDTATTNENSAGSFGRVALVHDWLTGYRGGEKVLESIAGLVGEAELYTLFHVKGANPPAIENRPIHSSWMNAIPGVHARYRWLLPFFPAWADGLDLHDYDLILSTSHCVAKGAGADSNACHVCYCHTPMRYVWDRFDDYFGHWTGLKRRIVDQQAKRLREWDKNTAPRVDRWVANSSFVRQRILDFYDVETDRVAVVAPPVDVERFAAANPSGGDRYLVVSALVPYKRIDVAVEACARSGRPLDVAGSGPELLALQELARATPDADIRFLGFVPDAKLPELMARHRAFLFPGVEDFGITVVEATAAGLPIIARGAGGALDSVRPGVNGMLYDGDSVDAMIAALDEFEGAGASYTVAAMREWAARFSPEEFRRRYQAELRHAIEKHRSRGN